MDPIRDTLGRLLEAVPDLSIEIRDEILRAGGEGQEPLRRLFERRAGETLRSAQEHHRRIEALIRRS